MNNPLAIRQLAYQRLAEAQVLVQSGMPDGAFYLAGYSVELMLKAKICERIGVPNIFDESAPPANQLSGIGEARRFLKTHNLAILLLFGGLMLALEAAKARDAQFASSLPLSSITGARMSVTGRPARCPARMLRN